MVNWLIDNWYIIFALAVLVFMMGMAIGAFYRKPVDEKYANIKEWLKWAVVEAEKRLGSKTGQLKLREVYGMAIEKFPWVAKTVTFELFSLWVDDALEWMNKQLESNPALKNYILGE